MIGCKDSLRNDLYCIVSSGVLNCTPTNYRGSGSPVGSTSSFIMGVCALLGSMTAENCAELAHQPDVDGFIEAVAHQWAVLAS